jgi:hypothetical protein
MGMALHRVIAAVLGAACLENRRKRFLFRQVPKVVRGSVRFHKA